MGFIYYLFPIMTGALLFISEKDDMIYLQEARNGIDLINDNVYSRLNTDPQNCVYA